MDYKKLFKELENERVFFFQTSDKVCLNDLFFQTGDDYNIFLKRLYERFAYNYTIKKKIVFILQCIYFAIYYEILTVQIKNNLSAYGFVTDEK